MTQHAAREQDVRPSNTSGGSTFSGLRCFVIGTSGLTCAKLALEVRYAMLFAIIVRS